MTPAEEIKMQSMWDRLGSLTNDHYEQVHWTCKWIDDILNIITGLAIAQGIEAILILLLLAHALKGGSR